jgi:pyruvate,water dikinase
MPDKFCLLFDEISREHLHLAGGKGANLGEMVRAGLPIPPGFVISAPAFSLNMRTSGIDEMVRALLDQLERSDPNALASTEKEIRVLIEAAPIVDELRRLILEYYHALGENVPVAVRSSATAEDLAGASFAGQQETFLNVVGEQELMSAVRKCWSSLYTSQAIFYRSQKGFKDAEVAMAVVIQKMINSEKAGVTFTCDPVTNNPYRMTIEGVWGLGEGIVSGTITPDHYKVDRETYEIVFHFKAPKTIMYCQKSDGGVHTMPVPADKAELTVLDRRELRELVEIADKVEKHFGAPQDIEWGLENGCIFVLQSRPVTHPRS